jgi:hypothetical protein
MGDVNRYRSNRSHDGIHGSHPEPRESEYPRCHRPYPSLLHGEIDSRDNYQHDIDFDGRVQTAAMAGAQKNPPQVV